LNKVVFTDIDGTLIDINTAEYGKKTRGLISSLKEKNIPLILASAKTWLEQNKIREDLGLFDPFIVENGGAIVIPKGYFVDSVLKDIQYSSGQEERIKSQILRKDMRIIDDTESKHHDRRTKPPLTLTTVTVIELGKPVDNIRAKLSAIRKKYTINFKGVADVSVEELSNIASMPIEQAKRMADRRYGETILQIERKDVARLIKYAEDEGMRVIHGGRFFDVTIGNDKGKAVEILRNLFKNKFHDDVTFFGIGDSTNDVSMLNLMDVPILVQKPDRSWLDYEIKMLENADSNNISNNNNNIIKINGIGPNGWENAVHKIILES
jgi:mannosyl-3-phosphoglycerate phosphatase family protein